MFIIKGTILGDIIGSRFEFEVKPIDKYNFKLFTKDCFFTDDTVLTIATMDALLNNRSFQECYHYWGNRYPNRNYGDSFEDWLKSNNPQPYNSYGNGSAMRVSPIGMFAEEPMDAIYLGYESALCSHNHIEGLKGASAVALAVYLAKRKYSKDKIKNILEANFQYNLSRKLQDIKTYYRFNESCQGSVPESIVCFLESTSWEDCIRNTVWLNGDTDTMCAISGAIAEAYYGIPQKYINKLDEYLPEEMMSILNKFYKKYKIGGDV